MVCVGESRTALVQVTLLLLRESVRISTASPASQAAPVTDFLLPEGRVAGPYSWFIWDRLPLRRIRKAAGQ